MNETSYTYSREYRRQPAPDPIVETGFEGCHLWVPGHCVHWVQGMRANRSDQPGSFEPCTITAVALDGWFTLELAATGESRRYWTHNIAKLKILFGAVAVEINERWSVVHQRQPDWSATHYISITQNPRPCVFEEPTGELHEQLETHGGFSISGQEALRRIKERAEAAKEES